MADDPELVTRALVEAFGRHLAVHPEKAALVSEGRTVSYAELDAWSSSLANGLLGAPPTAQPVVALASWLGPEAIAWLLATLKAGLVAAPLDHREPDASLLATAERLGARLVLPDGARAAGLVAAGPRSAVSALHELDMGDTTAPQVRVDPARPAFLASSSGTTGTPKTSVLTQSVVEVLGERTLAGHAGSRIGIVLPPAFLAAYAPITECWFTGATGYCLDLTRAPLTDLGPWMEACRLTAIALTPSIARMVAEPLAAAGRSLPFVERVTLGGEPVTRSDVRTLAQVFTEADFVNVYGSVDATLVSYHVIDDPAALPPGPVSAGRPVGTVEIVDADGEVVVPGEVGIVTAVGDWLPVVLDGAAPLDLAALDVTGERRVPTGDLGRITSSGELEVLGRADHRVKVRGQMVDPARVEDALTEVGGVRDAVVSAVPGARGTVLVAHVVPAGDPAPATRVLRRRLSGVLPAFMVPTRVVVVDELPRVHNGKADRLALADRAADLVAPSGSGEGPAGVPEVRVAGLVAEVLGIDDAEALGRDDDLFELGMDSIAAVELVVALSQAFGVEVAPAVLAEHPTVAELAEAVAGPSAVASGERPGRGRGLRSRLPRADGGRPLFALRPSGTRPPVYLVPGGGANLFQLRPFAAALTDRPVHEFVPKGVDARTWPTWTIAAAADRYVEALLGAHRGGPLLLGGSSSGAMVAWEMAQRLDALGVGVDLLVLLDPSGFADAPLPTTWAAGPTGPADADDEASPSLAGGRPGDPGRSGRSASGPPSVVGQALAKVRVAASEGGVRRVLAGARWYGEAWWRTRVPPPTLGVVRRPLARQEELFLGLAAWQLRRCDPRPYGGRVLVARARGPWGALPEGPGPVTRLCTGLVDVVDVPGDHESMLRPPHASALAAAVEAFLPVDGRVGADEGVDDGGGPSAGIGPTT